MEDGKVTKVGKFHGVNRSFETGPARGHKSEFSKVEKRGPRPSLSTGPAAIPGKTGGNKSKGTMTSGTKGDIKGEDKGGKSYATKGKVKGS